ncbi:MAG: hypothetical protein QNK30_14055 [Bacteroidales bacterium]|nr:hypothetical protein [Bacteroidales bacterium]
MEIDLSDVESEKRYRAYDIANTYGLIGEDEKAMEWLEKAYKSDQISPPMSFDLHFKNLHTNPRYIAILMKMGLVIQ